MSTLNEQYSQWAHQYIPGGAHTYSRGDDQFPANAPKILARGEGAYVWDVDGNRFLDFGMGLRSVTLGYGREEISQAAIAEIAQGNNLTRASMTEVLAAKELCEFIPWVEMVKFAKNGSNVVTAATKLARAFTGRKMIARCVDQPFFSFDDWFIGNTVVDAGIPDEIKALTVNFSFNNLDSLRQLFEKYPGQIACVITEAATHIEPKPGFLEELVKLTRQNGALVVIDEMITGFRWHNQGACEYYGIRPDLVTFGKAMANGFAVAALGGRRDVMSLGGLAHDKERVFLTSTTHGGEMCSLGALRATMKFYQTHNVVEHLWQTGKNLLEGLHQVAVRYGLQDHFVAEGTACSPIFMCFDADRKVSLSFRTLFLQEMIKNGVLMPWLAFSFAHREEEIQIALDAADRALAIYAKALDSGLDRFLQGPVVKPVFRKYNN